MRTFGARVYEGGLEEAAEFGSPFFLDRDWMGTGGGG